MAQLEKILNEMIADYASACKEWQRPDALREEEIKEEAASQIRKLLRDFEKPVSVRDRPPSQSVEMPWSPME